MLPSPTKIKRRLDIAIEHCDVVDKKLKNARGRENRAKATCRTLSDELRQLNLITDELKLKLESYSGTITISGLDKC